MVVSLSACQAALRFVKGLERALANVDGELVVVVFSNALGRYV